MASVNFHFLSPQHEKEPYIDDLLSVIYNTQTQALKHGTPLAQPEMLFETREIKMPFNSTRSKNIMYLLDMLVKNYPEHVFHLTTFSFEVDPRSKKMNIHETHEFMVQPSHDAYGQILEDRDRKSTENLLNLLGRFRLFNLTKLVKQAKNKKHLSRIIKGELGISIFTFKNYSLDSNNMESASDYCFHKRNYEAVKKKLAGEDIRRIIQENTVAINRRLNNFGILNSNFSDYTDSKLDYLLNIIINDIGPSLPKKDLMAARNFESLRACMLKVNKLLDPVISHSSEILEMIKGQGFAAESNILAVFPDLSRESLRKWAEEHLEEDSIFHHDDPEKGRLYFSTEKYMGKITDLYNLIINNNDSFMKMPEQKRMEAISEMTLLSNGGKALTGNIKIFETCIKETPERERLIAMISDFEESRKTRQTNVSHETDEDDDDEGANIVEKIITFFSSIFGGKKSESASRSSSRKRGSSGAKGKKGQISRETRNYLREIQSSGAPVLPISDYIEIKPDNEGTIDQLIKELRDNNIKIIIPIYNARKDLYPTRSQKVLLSDSEYLLVGPDIVNAPETIREFCDSIMNYKLKDEIIPRNTILVIEKYLLTIYRQRRAKLKRKKAAGGKKA